MSKFKKSGKSGLLKKTVSPINKGDINSALKPSSSDCGCGIDCDYGYLSLQDLGVNCGESASAIYLLDGAITVGSPNDVKDVVSACCGGSTPPVNPCADCEDYINGACVPKICGDCESCVNGQCVSNCTECDSCIANQCVSNCDFCQKCIGGFCSSACPVDFYCVEEVPLLLDKCFFTNASLYNLYFPGIGYPQSTADCQMLPGCETCTYAEYTDPYSGGLTRACIKDQL